MALLKRLTIRLMGVDQKELRKLVEGKKKPTNIARVVGRVDRLEEGEGDFGPFVKFHGQFRGINTLTGEVFDSNVALLPDVAANALASAVNGAEGGSVQFGFDITAQESDSTVGYEYGAEPLIKSTEADPMAGLLEAANSAKKLPAPAA